MVNVRQFRAECLPIIREIEQGGGDVIITRHGEPVARITGYVKSEPSRSFGCEADTLRVFVEDLSTEAAFADDEWDMVGNLDRILDPSR
jgi:prevent-host-death family protein